MNKLPPWAAHQKKSKFNIANKVNLESHWKQNDKIGDPEFKRKW